MECIHEMDPAWCAICRHRDERPPRRSQREPSLTKPRSSTKPDAVALHAAQILDGLRCGVCGHERLGIGVGGRDGFRQGMCRCERQERFEREMAEISEWANSLPAEHSAAVKWPAVQATRRATIRFGRNEPAQYGNERLPLIATTGFDARTRFRVPARWAMARGSVADELPV